MDLWIYGKHLLMITSTVVSGFGQLSTFVAKEVPRLIQSRDVQILAVQEACRALHANQKVLTGILRTKGGLITPPYPPISSDIPLSSFGNPRMPIQAQGAHLGTATSRTTTTSPSSTSSTLPSFPQLLSVKTSVAGKDLPRIKICF